MAGSKIIVAFSNSDRHMFCSMLSWKNSGHNGFNHAVCQIGDEFDAVDEVTVKLRCSELMRTTDTLVVLVGRDTRYKHRHVCWQVEVAIEMGCRIIAVNLDGARTMTEHTCPELLIQAGAIFVPFSEKIINYAFENFSKMSSKNYYYGDEIYKKLGY